MVTMAPDRYTARRAEPLPSHYRSAPDGDSKKTCEELVAWPRIGLDLCDVTMAHD